MIAAPILCDPAQASRIEWLTTDGRGSYAMGCVNGLSTRRYHGILMAAQDPPIGRTLLVSRVEETLIVEGARFDLAIAQWPNALHPRGDQYLVGFWRRPIPHWRWELEGRVIERSIAVVDGTAIVSWRLVSGAEAQIEIRPLLAMRGEHEQRHDPNDAVIAIDDQRATVRSNGLSVTMWTQPAVPLRQAPDVWRNAEHLAELDRGLDFRRVVAGGRVGPNRMRGCGRHRA